jgi:lipoprotein-anchoring transpeptidase ErfK/SrfK
MTTTTESVQLSPRNNKLANHWILSIILLTVLLLTALGVWATLVSRIALAHSSYAPTLGNLLVMPNLTPTAPPTATSTSEPTATSTSKPTTIRTTATSSTPEITVKVSGYFVNLRTGPGVNFAKVRKLTFGELLMPLGRLSDNTWLYVKTSDGLEDWVTTTLVDLAENNVEALPVKTRPASEIPTLTGRVKGEPVNLRTAPDVDAAIVRNLTYGEKLTLLGRLSNNTWLYVKTSDGLEGWTNRAWVDLDGRLVNYLQVKTAPPRVIPHPVALAGIKGHWIDIDLGDQMLYAFDGDDLVDSFLVSTGTVLYPTQTGPFHVYAKFLFIDMQGSDYYLPHVPFAMFYNGDFSIHGTYWHHNFGTRMSHGCINMDTKDAEWLYNWSQIGTLVYIHW